MSDSTTQEQGILGQIIQLALDTKGVSFLEEAPSETHGVKGTTNDGKSYTFCFPQVIPAPTATATSSNALTFSKDEKSGKVKFRFELLVEPKTEGQQPYLLTNVKLSFQVKNADGKGIQPEIRDSVIAPVYKQRLSGAVYLSLEEFVFLKQRLEEDYVTGGNNVTVAWSGEIQWVPKSKLEEFSKVKDINERAKFIQKKVVSGTVPLSVDPTNSAVYAGVSGLLNWESVEINPSNGDEPFTIWFKDALQQDSYYLLPQEFRIKANPKTNGPDMKITIKRDANTDPKDFSTYKVLMTFELAPYYNPSAERDLYHVLTSRTNGRVKVLNIKYGGHESASFQVTPAEKMNIAYNALGLKSLVEGDVLLNPDSSFRVTLEASGEAYQLIKQDLAEKSINVGTVNITVKNGLDAKLEVVPLRAFLNLRKLTQVNLSTKILDSTDKKIHFPHEVQLTNNGIYPLEVHGCELSILAEKHKGEVTCDVKHHLNADVTWPIDLGPGESKVFSLSSKDIETIKSENVRRAISPWARKWTELVCQPHSIRLPSEYIDGILEDVQDVGTNEYKVWYLTVRPLFDWGNFPDLQGVEVNIQNAKYGVDECVTLERGAANPSVNMCGNLRSLIESQEYKEFNYRLRLLTSTGTPQWGPLVSDSGETLLLTEGSIKRLLNAQTD